MPRLVPRGERSASPSSSGLYAVPTSSASGDAEAEMVDRFIAAQSSREAARCTAATPYTPQCRHSFFADIATLALAGYANELAARARLGETGPLSLDDASRFAVPDEHVKSAEARLHTCRILGARDLRDLSGATGSGGEFIPAGGAPVYIAELFATAARNRAVLARRLITRPLPDAGLKVQSPRFSGGAATAVQTAPLAAVQETDPVTALAESPTATIAGQLDGSQQLFDLGLPNTDEVLAAELAADYATKLEQQIVAGTGTAGQTLGLLNVVGVTAQTKTNASPTAASNLAAIGDIVQAVAAAYGAQPDDLLLVMPPRRYDWIVTKLGYAPRFPVPDANIVLAPAAVVGGQDRIIVLIRGEVVLFTRPPVFRAYPEVGSSTLTVRVQAYGYAALLANRQPAAIGVSSGTEWAAPTF